MIHYFNFILELLLNVDTQITEKVKLINMWFLTLSKHLIFLIIKLKVKLLNEKTKVFI